MPRMRLRLPWQLKLKSLFLLLAAISLTLVLFALYMRGHSIRFPHAVRKINPASMARNFFSAEELSEVEFMHIERQWKEPEWKIADVLHRVGAMKQKLVPVVVVEEHHEVLKYWFDAAAVGIIPQSGNTLLHIDGHSDAAPPRDLSIVPWFHLPRSHSQVANMMQSNDVFIAGAALTGLISRYIWVWPDWDYADHVNDSHHSVADVIAGWRIYSPPDGKPFQRHCACMRTHLPHSQSEGWECWNDESDLTDIGGSGVIKSKQCKAVLTAVVENVHEKKALELLKSGDWIRQDERVLLDIDEDYFGCESSVMPLYNAGLTQDFINQLSDLVSQFLCVNEVRFELIADKVFHTAVQIVRDFKTNLCGEKQSHDHAGCVSEFEADKALIHLIPKFSKTLRKAGVFMLMCHGTSGEVILQILLRMLFSLNFKQLDALNYVGVCLETAPTSMAYEPDSLHVCHGFNIPSDTQVTFHVPTVKENAMRSEILKNTLSLLPQQPTLVTVCRSMRDGYTPWAVFSAVEKSVMGILQSVFPGVAEDSFHFDENLLGGKKGWPERHHH